MNQISEGRQSDLIDRHVGARIRMRRRAAKISQEEMASALGLTFQQVQKYERGANRISASKLFKASEILKVSPGFFFEGLPTSLDQDASVEVSRRAREVMLAFLNTPEGVKLAEIFPLIRQGTVRRQILDLVRTLASELSSDSLAPFEP